MQAIAVVGAQPGSYPATVSWTQYNAVADRNCAGSASTTFSLAAPAPPHLKKPRATRGLPDETRVTLKFPAGADERPLVVRYRAVAKRRFPGPGARVHTFTVPLLVNPYGHATPIHGTVRVGGLKATIGPERTLNGTFPLGPQFTFHVKARPGGTPFGYEIAVLQGGRPVTRLRVTGSCGRVAGLVACKRGKTPAQLRRWAAAARGWRSGERQRPRGRVVQHDRRSTAGAGRRAAARRARAGASPGPRPSRSLATTTAGAGEVARADAHACRPRWRASRWRPPLRAAGRALEHQQLVRVGVAQRPELVGA